MNPKVSLENFDQLCLNIDWWFIRRCLQWVLRFQTLDTGWPDMHAPPLDKICTICKAMESWLNADPLHVAVIHCRVSIYHLCCCSWFQFNFNNVPFIVKLLQTYSWLHNNNDTIIVLVWFPINLACTMSFSLPTGVKSQKMKADYHCIYLLSRLHYRQN